MSFAWTEWDTLGIASSTARNVSFQRGMWIWLCLLGACEGVPSTTYFLDFREEPGTWYPGLHLYLQKDPTLCLFSRHLAVCRSALGTGGGARHMSSHRASGKDHSPSSMQVRMLLLPGRHGQSGLAEQWVHQQLRSHMSCLNLYQHAVPRDSWLGVQCLPLRTQHLWRAPGSCCKQTDMEARLGPCLLCVKIQIMCASYAAQEKALPGPSIIPLPCRCVSLLETVVPTLNGVSLANSALYDPEPGPCVYPGFPKPESDNTTFSGVFLFFLFLSSLPLSLSFFLLLFQTPALIEVLPEKMREQHFLPREAASSDRVFTAFRILAWWGWYR